MEQHLNLAPKEARDLAHQHYQEFDARPNHPKVLMPEQRHYCYLMFTMNPEWNDNELVIELVRHISRDSHVLYLFVFLCLITFGFVETLIFDCNNWCACL